LTTVTCHLIVLLDVSLFTVSLDCADVWFLVFFPFHVVLTVNADLLQCLRQ